MNNDEEIEFLDAEVSNSNTSNNSNNALNIFNNAKEIITPPTISVNQWHPHINLPITMNNIIIHEAILTIFLIACFLI